jgi:hypothetical protein
MKKISSFSKKHLVLPFFLLLSFYSYTQTGKVVIGDIDSLQSNIL